MTVKQKLIFDPLWHVVHHIVSLRASFGTPSPRVWCHAACAGFLVGDVMVFKYCYDDEVYGMRWHVTRYSRLNKHEDDQ